MEGPDPARVFIEAVLETLRYQRRLVEGAVGQLSDAQIRQAIAPGTNTIAVVLKHLAGNLRSRWTDFLTTDGEKPDRERESEFSDDGLSRDAAMARWAAAWEIMFRQVDALSAADLGKTVFIRGQAHTVPRAICRALDHKLNSRLPPGGTVRCFHAGPDRALAISTICPTW